MGEFMMRQSRLNVVLAAALLSAAPMALALDGVASNAMISVPIGDASSALDTLGDGSTVESGDNLNEEADSDSTADTDVDTDVDVDNPSRVGQMPIQDDTIDKD